MGNRPVARLSLFKETQGLAAPPPFAVLSCPRPGGASDLPSEFRVLPKERTAIVLVLVPARGGWGSGTRTMPAAYAPGCRRRCLLPALCTYGGELSMLEVVPSTGVFLPSVRSATLPSAESEGREEHTWITGPVCRE